MNKLTTTWDIDNSAKVSYNRIRNFLAGRLVGATRDRALLHEVIKCLFCRAKLVSADGPDPLEGKDSIDIAEKYRAVFSKLRDELSFVFDKDEEMLMDPDSITFVDSQLSKIDFREFTGDPLGDLYQSFIGTDLRISEGQFFTPHTAISFLVEALNPKPGELIMDPACGTGGFLGYSAQFLNKRGFPVSRIADSLYGIEKDQYLANLAQSRIAINTLEPAKIICGDSLSMSDLEGNPIPKSYMGMFDVVLTNPPFGSRIVSASTRTRADFELAFKWKLDKDNGNWVKTTELKKNTPPQVLFLERCLTLLKPGGRLGTVLPESLISSPTYRYVVQFLRKQAEITAVVGMPESLFKTSGKGGTHTKTCLLIAKKRARKDAHNADGEIYMAEAKWCGRDSRGNTIPNNDIPEIILRFKEKLRDNEDHLGYWTAPDAIENNILAPRYFNPELQRELDKLRNTHDLIRISDLVDKGVLEFATGDEVGKLAYGTGEIPFVRSSDISNWEIKIDPKHCISSEIYEQYKEKQDIKAGDILMVRDGTYLIGSCAYVSEYDEKIVYQSHLYKIRVKDHKNLSPYLLLSLLSCEPVVKQIQAKRFTQDIIDSLGKRIFEVLLPIPRDEARRENIDEIVKKAVKDRIEARELARKAKRTVVEQESSASRVIQ